MAGMRRYAEHDGGAARRGGGRGAALHGAWRRPRRGGADAPRRGSRVVAGQPRPGGRGKDGASTEVNAMARRGGRGRGRELMGGPGFCKVKENLLYAAVCWRQKSKNGV